MEMVQQAICECKNVDIARRYNRAHIIFCQLMTSLCTKISMSGMWMRIGSGVKNGYLTKSQTLSVVNGYTNTDIDRFRYWNTDMKG